jgi:hypothetical protein
MNELISRQGTDLQIPNMQMPMLPQILQSAMPIPIPQMTYEDGLVRSFFGNLKRKQIAKSKGYEAEIAEAAYREIIAKLGTVHAIISFSAKLKDTFEQYQYQSDHRKISLDIEKVNLEIANAELIQAQLKNVLLQGEAKLNEAEIKIKLKQILDNSNGTF